MRCRWFRIEIACLCAAWSIRANDDNDNHINDDNTGRARNNRTKCDFEADFNTALFQLLHGYGSIKLRGTERLAFYLKSTVTKHNYRLISLFDNALTRRN